MTHRRYKLGCEQYERLLARSGQRCEICGTPGERASHGKLAIDHGDYQWAVRGLLCNGCNSHLGKGRVAYPWCAEYLANAWWMQECARVGVPTTIMPEPDIGSVIHDQWGVFWLRERDRKWRPQGNRRPGISWWSWKDIYEYRGPQNMAPMDVYTTEATAWLQWHVEQEILKSLTVTAVA
jgi:hypothetical protein